MRRSRDDFAEEQIQLLYIARRLKEALAVEDLLTSHGIDYVVEPGHYFGGVIFHRVRVGAFFYVPSASVALARQLLRQRGYRPLEENL